MERSAQMDVRDGRARASGITPSSQQGREKPQHRGSGRACEHGGRAAAGASARSDLKQSYQRFDMAEVTTDHDTIRKWAESKGGKPAAVDRTHKRGDVGIVRIMFPDNPQSEHEALVEISWDEFFREFEAKKLALLYEQDSLFSKIIGRDT